MPPRMTLRRRLERKAPRLVKAARQWGSAFARGGRPDTRVVFVIGAQRSGTRLPLEVMDCSTDITTFSEGSSPYFNRVLLKPLDRVEQLLKRSPSPVVALKPICETHRVHELLDRFPKSTAIWIFRDYEPTALSASIKWTSGREAIRRMATGEMKADDWRLGGLTADKLLLVRRLYRDDMSLFEANTVMWWLRTGLFFDLQAYRRPEILLVRYEDLLAEPQSGSLQIFDFIGVAPPTGLTDAVRSPKPIQQSYPPLSTDVRETAQRLQERILAYHTRRASVPATEEPAGATP